MKICRICGAILNKEEDDICDDCFRLEREANPPIQLGARQASTDSSK